MLAFGLGLPPSYLQAAAQALAAGNSDDESGSQAKQLRKFVFGATQHKKIIHCYKAAESKWLDLNETFFGGNRRESADLDDPII